jgi:TRAP-type C4-dicarboxylate transport system substrate-binding protein
MNKPKIVGKVALLILLMLAFFSCGKLQDHRTLKLAHGLPTDHPVHMAMQFMADRCREISGEKLQIEIYAGGQLGSEQQCVELLQIGSLAITKVSAAVMESFTDDYKVLGLPYIFRDQEHAFKVFDGDIGQELLLSTENVWIRGLCFYDAGSRSFYTIDKPIENPDDLKGMKIRVMKSKTAMDMVQLLGGSPTPISWVSFTLRCKAVSWMGQKTIPQVFIRRITMKSVSIIRSTSIPPFLTY